MIRSLLSLSFLSLAYGFFSEKRTWLRWVLFLMTVPIAVVTNAGRVTATGVASEYDPKLAQGIFHTMEGMASWAVAMVLLSPAVWVKTFGFASAIFPYDNPALFSMTLAFLGIYLVSKWDRSARAEAERARYPAQFVRAETGLGAVASKAH